MTNDFFTNIPDYSGIGIYALINNRTGKMYIGASKIYINALCNINTIP